MGGASLCDLAPIPGNCVCLDFTFCLRVSGSCDWAERARELVGIGAPSKGDHVKVESLRRYVTAVE